MIRTPWQHVATTPTAPPADPDYGNQSHGGSAVAGTLRQADPPAVPYPLVPVASVLFHPWPHTVQHGDTLTSIAVAYGEPLAELEQDNAAKLAGHPDLIHPGLILIVMAR